MAVGCLRGYALNATIAARVAPSYTYTFSGHHQAELLRKDSPYCTTGEQAGRAGAHMVAPLATAPQACTHCPIRHTNFFRLAVCGLIPPLLALPHRC